MFPGEGVRHDIENNLFSINVETRLTVMCLTAEEENISIGN
jgi:hypothetical protein